MTNDDPIVPDPVPMDAENKFTEHMVSCKVCQNNGFKSCPTGLRFFDTAVARAMLDSNRHYAKLAWELIVNGWTFEAPDAPVNVVSWRWRRPSLRPGKPSRLFGSTDQAYRHMTKADRS